MMLPWQIEEAEWLMQPSLRDPRGTFSVRAGLLAQRVLNILERKPAQHIYVETSHLFIKLFADVAWSVTPTKNGCPHIAYLQRDGLIYTICPYMPSPTVSCSRCVVLPRNSCTRLMHPCPVSPVTSHYCALMPHKLTVERRIDLQSLDDSQPPITEHKTLPL